MADLRDMEAVRIALRGYGAMGDAAICRRAALPQARARRALAGLLDMGLVRLHAATHAARTSRYYRPKTWEAL